MRGRGVTLPCLFCAWQAAVFFQINTRKCSLCSMRFEVIMLVLHCLSCASWSCLDRQVYEQCF
jgi:hypothetical protein